MKCECGTVMQIAIVNTKLPEGRKLLKKAS